MNEKAKCKNCTDEMIEDMAKIALKNTMSYTCAKQIAMNFYEQNYRKIPEGSVVLDRHEHQKYCAYKIIEPQIKGCLDRERELEKQVAELEEQRDRQAYIAEDLIQEKHKWTEQARKETAEKTIKWFKENSVCIPSDEDINEFAKQFGVEVEVEE